MIKRKWLMKWLLFTVTVFLVFGLMPGVAGASPGVLAGNDVIDREYTDSWKNFYIIDSNNGFSKDSYISEFSVYISQKRPFKFMVYQKVDEVWTVVYEGDEITPTDTGVNTYTIDPTFIPAGSYVGLYFGNQGGAVPFDIEGPFLINNLEASVLFTNQGAESTNFLYSSERTYSVQAAWKWEARVTDGGQILAESEKLHRNERNIDYRISFGGGAYIVNGEYWLDGLEVTFHHVSEKLVVKGKFIAESLTEMNFFGDGTVANYTVLGKFNDVPGYEMIVRAQDSGEPGCEDNIRFELWENSTPIYDSYDDFPGESSYFGSARNYLDRGNIQIEDLR